MNYSKFNGSVIVKLNYQPSCKTNAAIRKGKLVESLEEIFKRIAVDNDIEFGSRNETQKFFLTDENHFTVMGKLFTERTYYIDVETIEVNQPYVVELIKNNEEQQNFCNNVNVAVVWAFDKRVLLHECTERLWPESAYRLRKSVKALLECERAEELLPHELRVELCNLFNLTHVTTHEKELHHCQSIYVQPRLASLEEICLIHDRKAYEEFIVNGTELTCLPSDVYCIGDACSSTAVRASAASVIDVAEVVYNSVRKAKEKVKQNSSTSQQLEFSKNINDQKGFIGFCLIRPPGHHCKFDTPSGFCLINNVAVASEYLLSKFQKENIEHRSVNESEICVHSKQQLRIAIIDLDVHFGDGTAMYVDKEQCNQSVNIQKENDHPLLYLSLHRYDDCKYYPYDKRGSSNYTGEQKAECICNVAINTNANEPKLCHEVISDHLMHEVMRKIFIPRLTQFKPDIIFVSLGFDAAYGDPLGKMGVVNGLTNALVMLKMWCLDGTMEKGLIQNEQMSYVHKPVGLIVVLEGGYNPECVSNGIVSIAYALTFPHNDIDVLHKSEIKVSPTWNELRERYKRRWCKEKIERENGEFDIDGVHEEQIPDDETLLLRHKAWCKDVIDTWIDEHPLTIGTLSVM